jgi:Uma2 family endonuclease
MHLTTVAEYRLLPDDGKLYELHFGEVVSLEYPRHRHQMLRRKIADLLEAKLHKFGEVFIEVPFRAMSEFDLRGTNVGAVEWSRAEAIDPEDNLLGAPDLVVELMMPSKTTRALCELAALCLATGAREFWGIDDRARTITVLRADGARSVYATGDTVPLTAFGSDSLSVSDIFA